MSLHVCNEYLFFVIIDTKLSYMIRKPNLGRARDVINHWLPVQLHRELVVVVKVYIEAQRPLRCRIFNQCSDCRLFTYVMSN